MVELTHEDEMALGWAFGTLSPRGAALREHMHSGGSLTRDAVVAIREEWEAAGRPSYQPHIHCDIVELPDATSVTACSFLGKTPYKRVMDPDFGLYLDARWEPPWTSEQLEWPDFGLPDRDALLSALEAVRERARAGESVEIGCHGGHGRTGTALACLAILAGVPASDAVEWTRAHYCSSAVERPDQETFVARFDMPGEE